MDDVGTAIQGRHTAQHKIKYASEFLDEQRKHSNEVYVPDCTVSYTIFSSVTLIDLAKKASTRKSIKRLI